MGIACRAQIKKRNEMDDAMRFIVERSVAKQNRHANIRSQICVAWLGFAIFWIVLGWCVAARAEADSQQKPNGFTISRHLVPRDKIIAGGPKRDAIPRVDQPKFASIEEASWIAADTPVIGIVLANEARAYPIHLLERHQVVNDRFSSTPIVVTYDPIVGAPLVYLRSVNGRVLTFGVSGLIYNSNFLLYDLETESLWSQFLGKAIAGPLSGTELKRINVHQEPAAAWFSRNRNSKVLMRPLPDKIDYGRSPFQRYWTEDRIPFPVEAKDERFHAKELVLGVSKGGKHRAYLGSLLTAAGQSVVDRFMDREIKLAYFSDLALFSWDAPDDVQVTEAYWFAWKAFYPDTDLWRDPGANLKRALETPEALPKTAPDSPVIKK